MIKPQMIDHMGFRPVIAYVDTDSGTCGSWGTSYECDDLEVKNETSWFIYKCMYCKHEEMLTNTCLATTSNGKRCRRECGSYGYCRDHSDTPKRLVEAAVDKHMPWQAETLAEYVDRAQTIAMLIAKRDILTRVKNMRDIALGVLYEKVVRNQEDCYVYFLRCGDYVKIGSSVDPDVRIEQLRKDNDRTLRPKGIKMSESVYIGSIAASRSVERDLHNVLNKYRDVGEWFKWTEVVEKTVTDVLADELSVKLLLERAIEDPKILEEIHYEDARHDMYFLEKEIKSANHELKEVIMKDEEEDEDEYTPSYGFRR